MFPPVASLKNVFFFLQILGKQSKFSETLRPRKEATLRHEILELGPYNNLAQHTMCSIFFKITPPYCTVHSSQMFSSRLNWPKVK